MSKKVFRLASRTEAAGADKDDVVFYLAGLDSMDGAIELARFPKRVLVGSPGLFERLLEAFKVSLGDFIEELYGVQPEKWVTHEPLEPRQGRA